MPAAPLRQRSRNQGHGPSTQFGCGRTNLETGRRGVAIRSGGVTVAGG